MSSLVKGTVLGAWNTNEQNKNIPLHLIYCANIYNRQQTNLIEVYSVLKLKNTGEKLKENWKDKAHDKGDLNAHCGMYIPMTRGEHLNDFTMKSMHSRLGI
jgi:endo-beta-N-acetylglucosaminidase D